MHIDQKLREIDQQIEDLRTQREILIRNQVITVGQLLDVEEELEKSPSDRMAIVSLRIHKILERLVRA